MGVGAILGAIVSIGGTAYSSMSQKKAQDEAQRKQQELEDQAREVEQNRLLEEAQRNEDAKAKISFGTDDDDDEMGSFSDFLAPKSVGTAGLGGVASTAQQSSGLGFGV